MLACVLLGAGGLRVERAALIASVADPVQDRSFDAAEARAVDTLAQLARASGSSPLAVYRAQSDLIDAWVANGRVGAEALQLARAAIAGLERLGLPAAPERATVLHGLGDLQSERGEFSASVRSHRQALRVRASLHVPPAVLADSHERLIRPLIRVDAFEEAREHARLARGLRVEARGTDDLIETRSLFLAAVAERYAGRYRQAVVFLDEADARGRLLPEQPLHAELAQVRGDVAMLQGSVPLARQAWTQAVAVGERTLRPEHPRLVLFLRLQALGEDISGDLATGRRIRARAVRIGEGRLPSCHPETSALLNDSAMAAAWAGQLLEARGLYEQAVRTDEQCLGPRHSLTAEGVHNLGVLLAEMGDFEEAERLQRRAVAIWQARLGPAHAYVARGVDALAAVLEARGDFAAARPLYERAVRIRRQVAAGTPSADVAASLIHLGRNLTAAGRAELALSHVDEAIGVLRGMAAGAEPDELAAGLALQGLVELRLGRPLSALRALTEALDERRQLFGRVHPLVATTQAQLAEAELASGLARESLARALEAELLGRDAWQQVIRYLPARQATAYASRRQGGHDVALSVAERDPSHTEAVADSVVRSRALVLEELVERERRIPEDANGDDPAAPLRVARRRFANLLVRSMREAVPANLLIEARRDKERLEGLAAGRTVVPERPARSVGLAEVRAALPDDTALVSFVRYRRITDGTRPPVDAYAAFVVRRLLPTNLVALGPANAIDDRISRWRDTVARPGPFGPGTAAGLASTRLRSALWEPITAHLSGVTTVLVVPDGQVTQVSLAALSAADGRFLAETGPRLHYLTSERDVLTASTGGGTGFLAVGDPAFRLRDNRKDGALLMPCGALGGSFSPLPGARAEVRELLSLWPRAMGAPEGLIGDDASEARVTAAAQGRKVLHFATHAFAEGRCVAETAAQAPSRAVGGLAAPQGSAGWIPTSGLALAGSSGASPEGDDGILTAEEIAGLNLQGTDWAVLSACDTGLGEIRAGEGVFGLRRAFQIAGARTVIMSLWSVDDQATRQWMNALYKGRFEAGLSTIDAVRNASLTLLRDRRAKGLSANPFYWAAFVAAGDWR